MKKQITHISIHQTSKVFAILYFVFSAIVAIPMGFYLMATIGMGEGLLLFFAPFFYMIFGYILIAILALIYNSVASSFGGIEITLTEMHGKGGSLE